MGLRRQCRFVVWLPLTLAAAVVIGCRDSKPPPPAAQPGQSSQTPTGRQTGQNKDRSRESAVATTPQPTPLPERSPVRATELSSPPVATRPAQTDPPAVTVRPGNPATMPATVPPVPARPAADLPVTGPGSPIAVISNPVLLLRTSNSPASQPASAPEELDSFPAPVVGQFTAYTISSGGAPVRSRQTIESIGPGPTDVTMSDQTLVNNQPIGKATLVKLPRFGRRWPAPAQTDARTVSYTREQIELAGAKLDCVVLTTESRAGGVTRIEKQWVCPTVPVTHIARLLVTTDGREVFRQELVEFGGK